MLSRLVPSCSPRRVRELGAQAEETRSKRVWLLADLIHLGWRMDRRVHDALGTTQRFLGGTLEEALATSEMTRLTVDLYELNSRRKAHPRELFPWELTWFRRDLPPPPARIFLAAAGTGAELRHLLQEGYHLDVLEPSSFGVIRCREMMAAQPNGHVFQATYEELNSTILDAASGRWEAPPPRGPYDAAILGWGSLTHVLCEAERRRTFEAMQRLVPQGPLLASFWLRHAETNLGRAEKFGLRVGRLIRTWRGLPPVPDTWFSLGVGFGHFFTRSEIEGLAKNGGYEVTIHLDSTYPHATFWPRAMVQSPPSTRACTTGRTPESSF